MKKEKSSQPSESLEKTKKRRQFGWLFGLSDEKRGDLPVRAAKADTPGSGKWRRKHWWWLLFSMVTSLIVWDIWKAVVLKKMEAVAYDKMFFRYDDQDYIAAQEGTLCGVPSVLMEDYDEFTQLEKQRREQDKTAEDTDAGGDLWIRQRPRLNTERLMYFERIMGDRVRVVYDNGACENYDFKDMMYNIQENSLCSHFQPIPYGGEVTEYVNLLYIDYFEKIRCPSKELYRVRLRVAYSSCATVRGITDCGVGAFSEYIYRKLRTMLEKLNPHVDYKYVKTVEAGECGC